MLQVVKEGYKGSLGVARAYRRLYEGKMGYKGLQAVTRDYWGLQGVTEG